MTVAEMHYIRSFKDSKTPEELAKDLKITVRRVKSALKKIEDEPAHPPGTPPKTDFNVTKGVVSMTGEQSEKDDKQKEKNRKSGGERFMNSRLKGCVGKVYPNKQ